MVQCWDKAIYITGWEILPLLACAQATLFRPSHNPAAILPVGELPSTQVSSSQSRAPRGVPEAALE